VRSEGTGGQSCASLSYGERSDLSTNTRHCKSPPVRLRNVGLMLSQLALVADVAASAPTPNAE
jgi:hypothetical protein